jgi:hypothetical protein
MAITAVLDCIGKADNGKDVAYIKFYKDGVLVKNSCINYDKDDIDSFKTEVGNKILSLETFTEDLKATISVALEETVQAKEIEIQALKEAELEEI